MNNFKINTCIFCNGSDWNYCCKSNCFKCISHSTCNYLLHKFFVAYCTCNTKKYINKYLINEHKIKKIKDNTTKFTIFSYFSHHHLIVKSYSDIPIYINNINTELQILEYILWSRI